MDVYNTTPRSFVTFFPVRTPGLQLYQAVSLLFMHVVYYGGGARATLASHKRQLKGTKGPNLKFRINMCLIRALFYVLVFSNVSLVLHRYMLYLYSYIDDAPYNLSTQTIVIYYVQEICRAILGDPICYISSRCPKLSITILMKKRCLYQPSLDYEK